MGTNAKVPDWLKRIPLAPEFRPTDTEFCDPIAYISKIEKEASVYGICKIIPPLPKPSKKFVFSNLNKSLLKCAQADNITTTSSSNSNDGEGRAVFTTRQQELGQSAKKLKAQPAVRKQVWQSGENYTLEQFESKSKVFARSSLAAVKEVSPIVIESLFWKAASEKPIYVEYANDVPGSAFGEPDGQVRSLHRRRRKRTSHSYRRTEEDSDTKKNETECVRNNLDGTNGSVNNDEVRCAEIRCSSTSTSGGASQISKRKSANANDEMEGSAGWEISNSPWNLQVIARSPGSLTRFMPDDIPGVTSPMVYIGMLFSWFAWHVEDHELHSMNYLHTGSSKTWYSVPGDQAFAFEELIRTDVYGGSIDRLAALTMLGEKTTLLSPEIIVASGIPCCRLVQNPGEFVVTFPRAYHVGFSHGFNCGEAANFGTPQWLKVAKEAAVRRAAMNILPMLSHQQLLYLLTMSFVLRVPRYLLPGARSSRLRDRQREEREKLVKKAFIEDMVDENKKLTLLLGKDSNHRTVLWHPDLLPYPNKESELLNKDTSSCNHENSKNQNNLYDEMNLYMGTLNDLDVDEDDLSSDFQMDSGTLACVACGILGFPFMSVIQPLEKAAKQLVGEHSSAPHGIAEDFVSGSPGPVTDDIPLPSNSPSISKVELDKVWSTSSNFFRPRIFCLEHALQIEELLRPKGGAKVLVICHSDYQKMKAHAMAVANDINHPFHYHEVPLCNASPEDLNLIYLAIDDELRFGEDWTSKLSINLRHCAKGRKKSPSMRIHHALVLDGLFSDNSSRSKICNVKWQFRRSRSKSLSNTPTLLCKTRKEVEVGKGETLAKKSNLKANQSHVKKEKIILQYSRRKYNSTNSGKSHFKQKAQTMSFSQDLDEQIKNSSTAHSMAEISVVNVKDQTSIKNDENSISRGERQHTLALEFTNTSRDDMEECDKLLEVIDDSCATEEILQEVQAHEKTQISYGGKKKVVFSDSTSDSVMQDENHMESKTGADEPVLFEGTSTSEIPECSDTKSDIDTVENLQDGCTGSLANHEPKGIESSTLDPKSKTKTKRKRKTELDQIIEDELDSNAFIKSPCEGLRPRSRKDSKLMGDVGRTPDENLLTTRKDKKPPSSSASHQNKKKKVEKSHKCDLENCRMSFATKEDLRLHKSNICPYEGCREKKFSTHKYAMLHQRVHEDARPLKCTWKGCTMSFKWAWARTEHIRVHTGERPYKCKVEGCGLSFRYVSDYSRHRRKTNHYVNSTS